MARLKSAEAMERGAEALWDDDEYGWAKLGASGSLACPFKHEPQSWDDESVPEQFKDEFRWKAKLCLRAALRLDDPQTLGRVASTIRATEHMQYRRQAERVLETLLAS